MWIKRQVVMLPTEEEANIFLEEDKTLTYYKHKQKQTLRGKGINLYILSDEKPVTGDWVIPNNSKYGNRPWKFMEAPCPLSYWGCADNCKKIIATTDSSLKYAIPQSVLGDKFNDYFPLPQPSQQFIQKYVEEYNKGNIITEVMAEYVTNWDLKLNSIELALIENKMYTEQEIRDSWYTKLKVNPKDNTITIRKVKDSWNREEVKSLIVKALDDIHGSLSSKSDIDEMNEWIKENL